MWTDLLRQPAYDPEKYDPVSITPSRIGGFQSETAGSRFGLALTGSGVLQSILMIIEISL